ncbi:LemA family protein [Acidovorax radicis]|uniref:LemA family protein n=1 Tax=Acidovorax radicis TaxID=758826 RepID=UPI001CFAB03E|nr:LemA family protein [Acidovorax radicis]UCU99617.1 LemA family protein [Acidovorax radicis]
MFWSSPLFWIAIAIFLFWALGAYNRLMRLRSAVVQSFGNFDAHMVRLVALLGEFGATQATRRGSLVADDANHEDAEAAALQGAANQLSASLAVARARPLHPGAMAALSAARDVLQATWHSAARKMEEPPMATDVPLPQTSSVVGADQASVWQVRWDEYALQNEQATQLFNDAVRQYNEGVAQFPANLLAKVFGFKAACAL